MEMVPINLNKVNVKEPFVIEMNPPHKMPKDNLEALKILRQYQYELRRQLPQHTFKLEKDTVKGSYRLKVTPPKDPGEMLAGLFIGVLIGGLLGGLIGFGLGKK
jgi:hypothetical protein